MALASGESRHPAAVASRAAAPSGPEPGQMTVAIGLSEAAVSLAASVQPTRKPTQS